MVAIIFSPTVLYFSPHCFSIVEGCYLRINEYYKFSNLQNLYKNLSKEIKSDNFCYRKVGRAITKWGAIEKSPILLSQYWKNDHL